VASAHFKSYIANINRIRMVELVEHFNLERRALNFRASLVVNPITGLPYENAGDPDGDGSDAN
jgi:hypothetical protein